MSRRLALAAALLSTWGLAPAAAADDDPASAPPAAAPRPSAPEDPVSALAAGPLRRADRVVVAHVSVVRAGPTGGFTIARAEVERVLKGPAAPPEGETITIFIRGPRPTMNPRRPSEPILGEGDQGRRVLFLRASPSGSGWDLDSTFELDGPVGDEKLEALAAEVALAAIADPAERRTKTLEYLLRQIGSERPWTRLHAAREMGALAAASPDSFSDASAERVARVRRRSTEPAMRDLLGSVLVTLHRPVEPLGRSGESLLGPLESAGTPIDPATKPPAAPGPAGAPVAPPLAGPKKPIVDVGALRAACSAAKDPDTRVEALTRLAKGAGPDAVADLEALLADSEPLVRERAVVLLGDVGDSITWARLRERYTLEQDVAVREAYVRAAGLLGEGGDVPWVAARSREPGLRVAGVVALARLRTPAALEALAEHRARALAAASPDEAFVKQVDYLASDAFVDAETKAGRRVGRGPVRPSPRPEVAGASPAAPPPPPPAPMPTGEPGGAR